MDLIQKNRDSLYETAATDTMLKPVYERFVFLEQNLNLTFIRSYDYFVVIFFGLSNYVLKKTSHVMLCQLCYIIFYCVSDINLSFRCLFIVMWLSQTQTGSVYQKK